MDDNTTHSMNCPIDGCDHVLKVHAHSDDDAVRMIMEAGKAHFDEVHPDEKGMNAQEMEKMTRDQMKSLGHQDH